MLLKLSKKLMNKLILLVCGLIVSIAAFSQQYNFIGYSVAEGLAQSQVRAIPVARRKLSGFINAIKTF
jgi:hypothetical protein